MCVCVHCMHWLFQRLRYSLAILYHTLDGARNVSVFCCCCCLVAQWSEKSETENMQVHINNTDNFFSSWSVRYICIFDLIPWYDTQTLNSDIIFFITMTLIRICFNSSTTLATSKPAIVLIHLISRLLLFFSALCSPFFYSFHFHQLLNY